MCTKRNKIITGTKQNQKTHQKKTRKKTKKAQNTTTKYYVVDNCGKIRVSAVLFKVLQLWFVFFFFSLAKRVLSPTLMIFHSLFLFSVFVYRFFLSICFQCLVSSWQSLNITTPELRLPIGRAVLKTWFPTVPPQGCQHQGFDDVGCTIVFSCAVELVIAHIPPLFSRSLPCWSLFNNLRLNLTPFVDALNILKHTGPYS